MEIGGKVGLFDAGWGAQDDGFVGVGGEAGPFVVWAQREPGAEALLWGCRGGGLKATSSTGLLRNFGIWPVFGVAAWRLLEKQVHSTRAGALAQNDNPFRVWGEPGPIDSRWSLRMTDSWGSVRPSTSLRVTGCAVFSG